MSSLITRFALWTLVAGAGSAQAQDVQTLRSRSLAATCAQCHGTDGHAGAGALVPGLAGMPAATLAERMRSFRDGRRPGTLMPQLAKGYSDAQIDQLAAYFATLAPAP
jgi:sulfide dehydrogenase cytochrome subunit